MNKTELKELVKKYFKLTEENNTPEENQAFAEATLIDGTKITNMQDSEFAVGNVVHVITETGEHVIAPSGEHELESGIVITVDGEGIITGIKRPGEGGEGSLAEHQEEEMSSEKVEATEDTSETDDSEEKTEMAEHVDENAIPDEAIGATFDEGEIKEAIVEAIADVVAPEIEALKEKMADIEEKMKDYMSEPSTKPALESRFNAIQEIKNNKKENTSESFNAKKAQMDMVLNAFKSKIKTANA